MMSRTPHVETVLSSKRPERARWRCRMTMNYAVTIIALFAQCVAVRAGAARA